MIGKLSRGEAPDTGLPRVELAWSALDKAATAAATAYATHVAGDSPSSDPLPAALDKLDAARTGLRAAAGMAAETATGKPLPPASLVPIALGGTPLAGLELTNAPSAHGLVAFGTVDGNDAAEVVLRPGQPPLVARVEPGMLRALPDGAWAARPDGDKLDVGTADAAGAIASPTALALPGAMLAAIIGTPALGAVVYGNEDKLVVAYAVDGKLTAKPTPVDSALVQTDVDGRALVAWSSKGASFAQLLGPSGNEAPVALADPPNDASCLAVNRGWILSNGTHLVGIAGHTVALRYPDGPSDDNLGTLVGCTPWGAVVRSADTPERVLVCDTSCQTVALPSGAPDGAALALVAGKPVAIAADAQVVGVWRNGAAPAYYALPAVATPLPQRTAPQLALSDGKVIDVVASTPHGYALIRLPAP